VAVDTTSAYDQAEVISTIATTDLFVILLGFELADGNGRWRRWQ
jgi:hypothetical protein